MSATVVRAKRQTTLPEDVCQAAGIRIRDQVDWRFEDGEIRGRKLVPALGKAQTVRHVKFKDLLILPQDIVVDFDEWDRQLRKDREERDEHLLAGVERLLTRNATDFSGLTGSIPVEAP